MSGQQFFGSGSWPLQRHDLFYAIILSPEIASVVYNLTDRLKAAHELSGTTTAPARMHVTLCPVSTFEGNPARWKIAEARRVAEAVAAETAPFDVAFNRVVGFDNTNGAKLALCGGDDLKQAVLLQHRLRSTLRRAGIVGGRAALSRPHLTLVYDAGCAIDEHPIMPVRWHVREFVLIDSLHGRSQHMRLGSWALRG